METPVYIVKVTCNDNITIDVVFNDNTERNINVGEFIRVHPHPQYNKYLNPVNFKKGKLIDGMWCGAMISNFISMICIQEI